MQLFVPLYDVVNVQSAALVADLRQEVAEGKNALNKNIEEMVHHKAIEAIEVQKSNELIRTLRDQNDEVQIACLKNRRDRILCDKQFDCTVC